MMCFATAAPQQAPQQPSAAALAPPKEAGRALCVEQEQQLMQQSPVNALEVGQGSGLVRPRQIRSGLSRRSHTVPGTRAHLLLLLLLPLLQPAHFISMSLSLSGAE